MSKFDIIHEEMTDDHILDLLTDDQEKIDVNIYTFDNYLKKARMKPDMKMIFGNFFQTGELCILAGKTGVGKSILGYQIADGISRGINILDQENETGPQKVIYYDFELNEGHIKKRFFNYQPNENFFRPDITDILIKNEGDFNLQIISEDVELTGAQVIIIDNITAIALKSTQDQDTAMNIMKEASLLKREKDISIMMLAHTPKIRESRPLELYDIAGSANIHNFIDNAMMIGKSTQDIDKRYIKQVKNRNSSGNNDVLVVSINSHNWLHYNYVGMDEEIKHLEISQSIEESRKNKLREIADNIIGNTSIGYNDFCHQYSQEYQKTFDNGKKILSQLQKANIIVKDSKDHKYILNGNETD